MVTEKPWSASIDIRLQSSCVHIYEDRLLHWYSIVWEHSVYCTEDSVNDADGLIEFFDTEYIIYEVYGVSAVVPVHRIRGRANDRYRRSLPASIWERGSLFLQMWTLTPYYRLYACECEYSIANLDNKTHHNNNNALKCIYINIYILREQCWHTSFWKFSSVLFGS